MKGVPNIHVLHGKWNLFSFSEILKNSSYVYYDFHTAKKSVNKKKRYINRDSEWYRKSIYIVIITVSKADVVQQSDTM